MTARRKYAAIVTAGMAGLFALSVFAASPAEAHGSMTDPVSRVSACFAEGPESPASAACKAVVKAGGTQPLYDWNGVNIANAAGKSKEIIPDGKLCSAANDKYRGLDLARADWPASKLTAGSHTFHYKATAPHKGSFELYLTKPGYDPAKPLKWSDLQEKPFVKVTDPKLVDGDYVFEGKVPKASGRQLIYSIWQRSDSPEAFYTCSDVVFGKSAAGTAGTATGTAPAAPTEKEIADNAAKSSVEHHGHGDGDAATHAAAGANPAGEAAADNGANEPKTESAGVQPAADQNLAETGGNESTPFLAIGGASVLALGAAALFASVRRRTATGSNRR